MDPSVVVAIIGVVGSVTAAAITSWFTAQRALVQIEVKVDLLWKTYIVDAIKDARTGGLVASRSPEAPTEKWDLEIPLELRRQIESTVLETSKHMSSPYDITIETIASIGLENIMSSTNLQPRQVIGTIFILTERILDGTRITV